MGPSSTRVPPGEPGGIHNIDGGVDDVVCLSGAVVLHKLRQGLGVGIRKMGSPSPLKKPAIARGVPR